MEMEGVRARGDEERHQASIGRELDDGGLIVERRAPAGKVELVEGDAERNRGGDRGPVIEGIVIGERELSVGREAREILRLVVPEEGVGDGFVVREQVDGDGQELAFGGGADGEGVALELNRAGQRDLGELIAVAGIPPREVAERGNEGDGGGQPPLMFGQPVDACPGEDRRAQRRGAK